MKTTWAEWDAFLESLPRGCYLADAQVTIDGVHEEAITQPDATAPDVPVEVVGGAIFAESGMTAPLNLQNFFKKWRTKHTPAFVTCQIPNEKLDDLKKFLATVGGKVLKR